MRIHLSGITMASVVAVVAVAQDTPKKEVVRPPTVTAARPFGTQRELAAMQQVWLSKRLDTFVPGLMRKQGIDLWVITMREYNEDPVFKSITSAETMAARRRTIYVMFDKCAATNQAPSAACIERIALGGTSQGGVWTARRSA